MDDWLGKLTHPRVRRALSQPTLFSFCLLWVDVATRGMGQAPRRGDLPSVAMSGELSVSAIMILKTIAWAPFAWDLPCHRSGHAWDCVGTTSWWLDACNPPVGTNLWPRPQPLRCPESRGHHGRGVSRWLLSTPWNAVATLPRPLRIFAEILEHLVGTFLAAAFKT